VGCGLLARPDGYGGAAITGDPAHPANFGRICSKGSALGETLGLTERLLHPMLRQRDGSLARVDWPDALDRVATGFESIRERHGPDALAFYLSGQLLTEDYYVANKLMKGFIGSSNVDTNSRPVHGLLGCRHIGARSAPIPCPGTYEDLDRADLSCWSGSNAAWCHPVLFQRMSRHGASVAPRSWSSIRAAPRPRTMPICFCRSRPALTRLCSAAAGHPRRCAGARSTLYRCAHRGFEKRLAQRAPSRPTRATRGTGLPSRRARASSSFSARPARVTCFRRA
jgi:hypothetical protein